MDFKKITTFFGLAGYFRKFIPSYAFIAVPLIDLLKKDRAFEFGEREKEAFVKLKEALRDKPVLSIYREDSEVEVHTDASKDGFGAILLQRTFEVNQFHPVYYFSKKTTETESKYCSYELEVMAVVEALRKFRVYLLGKHFKVVKDCAAFQKTMAKKDLTPKIARWSMFLSEFDFEVEHRSGSRTDYTHAHKEQQNSLRKDGRERSNCEK